jgi:hypothetical protein
VICLKQHGTIDFKLFPMCFQTLFVKLQKFRVSFVPECSTRGITNHKEVRDCKSRIYNCWKLYWEPAYKSSDIEAYSDIHGETEPEKVAAASSKGNSNQNSRDVIHSLILD